MTISRHLLRESDGDKFRMFCEGFFPSGVQAGQRRQGAKVLDHIEEVDLTVQRSWAVADRASSTDSPYSKNVLDGTSGNIVDRTQDPDLTKGNKLPGDMAIMIYAVSATVRLGNYSTIPIAIATQADLDRSKLLIRQGGRRCEELVGQTFMDFGPGLLPGNDTTAPNTGRQPSHQRVIRPLNICRVLGDQQTLQVDHLVARTADWGAVFSVDYCLHAIIGRRG